MDLPPLKLIMVRGPREGETIEFRAGSTIRIGRVVRGNNLPIKDSGISTKHLTIESEPQSGKWTITDLDSSNGTTLNSTKLPAHSPFDLVDGDTIKLGEYTSILIKISGHDESKLRRNPRRQANAKNTKVEVEEGENGEELKDNREIKEKRGRARGRPPKGEKVERRENVRVTRSRKNEGFVVSENSEVLLAQDLAERNVPEKMEVECGGRENNEEKKAHGTGKRRRKNLKEEDKETNHENKENAEVFREEGGEEVVVIRGEVENGGDCEGKGRDDKVEEGLDLERMTLGEWFDYMEANLQKQIIEETEEMIEGMRRKAERVKEYMIEKEKGKVPVG